MIFKLKTCYFLLYLLIIDFLSPHDNHVFAKLNKEGVEVKCNKDVDKMIKSANLLMSNLEPLKLKGADVKPCRRCFISGISTAYRAGNATSKVVKNLKTISFTLGVGNLTLKCYNCIILPVQVNHVIGRQNASIEIQGLEATGNLTVNKKDDDDVTVHESSIVTFGVWIVKTKGKGILGKIEEVLIRTFKPIIMYLIRKKVRNTMKAVIKKAGGKLKQLFMLC